MTHQRHDKLAKIVIETLAQDRQVSFETEMWPDIRGDVIVSPGQPLPAFTGMLGTLLEQGTTLLEFYHGRPAAVDLLHARAKGTLLQARTLKQLETAPATSDVQVVIVSIGHPRSALRGVDVLGTLPTRSPLRAVLRETLTELPIDPSECASLTGARNCLALPDAQGRFASHERGL